MAIQTLGMRNSLATAYKNAVLYGALYTTAPGATAGTEVTGAPYARVSLASLWSTVTNGVVTATATFTVPAGVTVLGAGLHDAATAGTYLDGQTVPSWTAVAQGPYQVTFTYSQS